jgi:DNA polymerase-4
VVTVRFETRGTGPGPARTFPTDSDDITPANPLDSLDWPDYLAALADVASEQSVDDVVQG